MSALPKIAPYTDPPITQKEQRTDGTTPERASLRIRLHSVQVRDVDGSVRTAIVGAEVASDKQGQHWILPKPEPRVHYTFSDAHGSASVSFLASMPKAEQDRLLAIAKSVHGPDSDLPCCIARRESGQPFVERTLSRTPAFNDHNEVEV